MVNLIKVFAILFLVLPAYISANACQVTVASSLTVSGKLYNTYKAQIINVGDVAIGNVILTPSDQLFSIEGLVPTEGGYEIPAEEGGISVDQAYSFTYAVESGKTVTWSDTCTATEKLSFRNSHKSTTTTQKPSKATTTTTVKPSKSTTTVKPSKATTTTVKPAKATTTTAQPSTKASATSAPSESSTTAASGTKCSGGSWWAPAPSTTWQWQLTGTIDTSIDVQMYDIDLFDNTVETISTLHSAGRVVICYFSTQYEDWRPDASSFTPAVIGNALDGWVGENYVDIRSTVVRNIMEERLTLAVTKGCDGVEPDNVDGYTAKSGFPLTAADQLDFNEFIATQAHARGLSVGLKNDVGQADTLQPYFDWSLNEQCYEYSECDTLNSFITNGKAVFNCEYTGSAAKICPYMVGKEFSSLMKGLDLTATIKAQCCTYASGGCAAAPAFTCVTAPLARSLTLEDNETTLEVEEDAEVVVEQEQEFASSATTTYVSMLVLASAFVALNL